MFNAHVQGSGIAADHVGHLCVCGGCVSAPAAEDDAEGKGGREVHGPLRVCFGPVQIH